MLKLITVNIEGDNHYDKIFPFFEREQPDVICIQEFFSDDLPIFEEKLGMQGYCIGMWTCSLNNTSRVSKRGEMGVAIFSKLPLISPSHAWYVGDETKIVEMFEPNVGPEKVSRALLWVDVEKEERRYRIATTHFTWSPAGSVTDIQRRDLANLQAILNTLGEVIICGDFNAPRGKEIFDTLASQYKDNVPTDVITTLDNSLHRIKTLEPLVVDVLFTTPAYQARNVKVASRVSDHCAIVGEIK